LELLIPGETETASAQESADLTMFNRLCPVADKGSEWNNKCSNIITDPHLCNISDNKSLCSGDADNSNGFCE